MLRTDSVISGKRRKANSGVRPPLQRARVVPRAVPAYQEVLRHRAYGVVHVFGLRYGNRRVVTNLTILTTNCAYQHRIQPPALINLFDSNREEGRDAGGVKP